MAWWPFRNRKFDYPIKETMPDWHDTQYRSTTGQPPRPGRKKPEPEPSRFEPIGPEDLGARE